MRDKNPFDIHRRAISAWPEARAMRTKSYSSIEARSLFMHTVSSGLPLVTQARAVTHRIGLLGVRVCEERDSGFHAREIIEPEWAKNVHEPMRSL